MALIIDYDIHMVPCCAKLNFTAILLGFCPDNMHIVHVPQELISNSNQIVRWFHTLPPELFFLKQKDIFSKGRNVSLRQSH